MSSYTNSQIYSLAEYLFNGLPVSAPIQALVVHRFTHPVYTPVYAAGLRPMLSLCLNNPSVIDST